MSAKNAKQLIKDLNKKIAAWDERNCFVVRGVKNLSYADMNDLLLYAEVFLAAGSIEGLLPLHGRCKKVWDAYCA